MRVLVIGAAGQLGTDLCGVCRGDDLTTADIDTVDIRDAPGVERLINAVGPEVVINCAAVHNVPKCQAEPETAFAVNATGALNLAVACRKARARLVHISTDYVFGSGLTRPQIETDPPAPLSVYGASKLAGEHLIAAETDNYQIFRTAGLYGNAPCVAKGGMNFVKLMLHLAATRGNVRVVTDEITTPTYTVVLAAQVRLAAEQGEPGLYHATCGGGCSWYEFAETIFALTNTPVKLVAATCSDFPAPVKRPAYSVLENKHLQDQGIDIMPHWRDALDQYLHAAKPSNDPGRRGGWED